ncbi:MAG: NAD(P)-dependent alcohol dehydrogenase [Myxococcota bacterium]
MNAADPAMTLDYAATQTMRAMVQRRYGQPDVLALEEVPRPAPGDGEVLVRVHAAGVTIGDHHVVTGKPYLIRLTPFGGIPRPRHAVPGAILSGRVEAVGAGVTAFRQGDEVFGQAAHGAFAEYVVLAAERLAPKPHNLSFEEAALVPWGATALRGLRDAGRLKPGQRLLVNGASGAVGGWAVQIGKAMGAEVIAVCSTRNVERMRALGADRVVDYTKEDFCADGAQYDVIFDTVGNRSLSDLKGALTPRGTFVSCSGGGGDWVGPVFYLVRVLVTSLFTEKRLTTFVMTPKAADLEVLKELVESGKARPVIERSYALGEAAEALRQVGEGHSQGQTVLRIA